MNRPTTKAKRWMIAAFAAVLLAVVGIGLVSMFAHPTQLGAEVPQNRPLANAIDTEIPLGVDSAVAQSGETTDNSVATNSHRAPSSVTDTSDDPYSPGFPPNAYEKDRRQLFMEFWDRALSWTASEFQTRRRQTATLSGEEIYQVYVYLRTCLSAPVSDRDFQQRATDIEQVAANNDTLDAEWAFTELEKMRVAFNRCAGIEGNLHLAALDWLTLAAERGYPLAQIAYYQSARWLLTMPSRLLFRYPERVFEYRDKAPSLLNAAVDSGHPEAFIEYALALDDGIVFERDPITSYAYAHAADLAGHGQWTAARNQLAALQPELSPNEMRDARELGRRLCERHCR